MSLFFPTSVLRGIVAPYTLCQVTASYTSWARALPFTNWPGCFPSSLSLPPLLQPDGWGALLGPDSSRPRSCSLSQPACSGGSANLIHHTLTVFCSCTHTLHFFNTAFFFPSDSSRLCLTHHDSLVFSSLIFPPLLPRPLIIQP